MALPKHRSRQDWTRLIEATREAVRGSIGGSDRVYGYLSKSSQDKRGPLGLGARAINLSTQWVVAGEDTPGRAATSAVRRLCAARVVGLQIVDEVYAYEQRFPPQFERVARVEPTDKPTDLRPLAEADPHAIGLVLKRDDSAIGVALQHNSTPERTEGDVPTILPITYDWLVAHPRSGQDVHTAIQFVADGIRAQTA